MEQLNVIPLSPIPYIGKYNNENYELMKPFSFYTQDFNITDKNSHQEELN